MQNAKKKFVKYYHFSIFLKQHKKLVPIFLFFVCIVLIILLSSSYAYFKKSDVVKDFEIIVNSLTYDLISEKLNDNNQITVSACGTVNFDVIVTSNNLIDTKYQMIYTSSDDLTNVEIGYILETLDTTSGTIKKNGTKTISIAIKNHETSPVVIQFAVRGGFINNEVSDIILESNDLKIETGIEAEYTDESGANMPELTCGMIPVKYDGTNWVKADTKKAWYNYDEQMWANAVTVTEKTRANYMSLPAGEPISMNDINTMWVWIPRYEYQYTNLGTSYAGGTPSLPGAIEMNFISKYTITPSDSSIYKIPEGFTFGSENLSGFWMAKFETSTLQSCVATSGSIGTQCDSLTLTPQVKPNATSWRGVRLSTFFQASRLMQSSNDALTYNADTYGFDEEGPGTMDVHISKNSEWGIVAYLSQSKYGKYGNLSYTGVNKEVYQNKSDLYITGMSNGTPSTSTYANRQVTYDTPNTGYGASTTGTIYGVYDMSGCAYEYVMGNFQNYSGQTSANSGFCGTNGPTDGTCRQWPDTKYYDLYESTTVSSAYKAGDGTHETSGWYNDGVLFVDSVDPWFIRSVYYDGSEPAGVFYFDNFSGRAYFNISARLSIKP